MNNDERVKIREAIGSLGFNRKSYTQDKELDGSYTETWEHLDTSIIVINWAPQWMENLTEVTGRSRPNVGGPGPTDRRLSRLDPRLWFSLWRQGNRGRSLIRAVRVTPRRITDPCPHCYKGQCAQPWWHHR